MTAIGVMQLWEQGKFQLDDSVNDHLKSFKIETKAKSSPPITIKHLLTHTSGTGFILQLATRPVYKYTNTQLIIAPSHQGGAVRVHERELSVFGVGFRNLPYSAC
jgi:CubicO group peptidase (beta-lactamase class C family)